MSFSEEKRKKLIVPAVALMMCAVAMIGIGYASINSSVTNEGNTLEDNTFSIDLYSSLDGDTAISTKAFNTGKVVFSTHKKVNNTATTKYDVASQVVKMNSSDVYIGANYTDPESNSGNVKLNIYAKKTSGEGSDVTIESIAITVKVGDTQYKYTIDSFSGTADSDGFYKVDPVSLEAPLTLGQRYTITTTATVQESLGLSTKPTLPTFDFKFIVSDSSQITEPTS